MLVSLLGETPSQVVSALATVDSAEQIRPLTFRSPPPSIDPSALEVSTPSTLLTCWCVSGIWTSPARTSNPGPPISSDTAPSEATARRRMCERTITEPPSITEPPPCNERSYVFGQYAAAGRLG